MRVIQGAWSLKSGLYLWGEDGLQSLLTEELIPPQFPSNPISHTNGENTSHYKITGRDCVASHPRALSHECLIQSLEKNGLDNYSIGSLHLLVPCSANEMPLPSPRLLLNESNADPFTHWQTFSSPALYLDPLSAISFLTAPWAELPHGLCFDHSLLFWVECSKLLLELLTRGMFLPTIYKVGGNHFASWELVIAEDTDLERFNHLCRAMPQVCRNLVEDRGSSASDPYQLLTSFLQTTADHLIRVFLRNNSLYPIKKDVTTNLKRLVCTCWLEKLSSPNNTLLEIDKLQPKIEFMELEQQLKRWKRSISSAVDIQPLLPCFSLQSPETSSETHYTTNENISPSRNWKLEFGLQSPNDSEIMITAKQLWQDDFRHSFSISGGFLSRSHFAVEDLEDILLRSLAQASNYSKPLEKALDEALPTHILLNTNEAYEFLTKTKPLLEKSGYNVILPNWWTERVSKLGLHLQLNPLDESDPFKTGLGLNELVSFSWRIALGSHLFTVEEFRTIADVGSPLIFLDNEWYELPQSRVGETIAFLDRQSDGGNVALLEALRLAFSAQNGGFTTDIPLPITGVAASGWIDNLLSGSELFAKPVEQPLSFHGELRPYQLEGLSWLAFLSQSGIGGCLADDMGLGKTIQLLAYLTHEKENHSPIFPCLLFAPMSVVDNWERETKTFTPSLKVHLHHGPQRLSGKELFSCASNSDLVVTTYSLGYRDEHQLSQIQWGSIVLDEAQNIKNQGSKQSQAIRRLSRPTTLSGITKNKIRRFALTGTPLENHLEELWSIFDFLNPGLLGTVESFRGQYAIPIEKYKDRNHASKLSNLVRPFLLRRVKTDPRVISDLPDKIEMDIFVQLSAEQVTLYQKVLDLMLSEISHSEGIHRKGLVLSMITRLKQVCNHPSHFLHDANLSPERSGKLQSLEEMLEVIVSEGDKVLVFTQFAQMGKILKTRLQDFLGQEVLFLYGDVPKRNRMELIDRFQSPDGPQVFILSLKAGGYGLNLTAATQVIHYDQWWNPAVHEQATDRAHRIGQKNPVQVRRFICKGTLEERIAQMLQAKRNLADMIVSETKSIITQMSTSELRNLLQLTDI